MSVAEKREWKAEQEKANGIEPEKGHKYDYQNFMKQKYPNGYPFADQPPPPGFSDDDCVLIDDDGFGSYDPACDPIYLNEDDGGDAWLADIASMVRDDDEPPAAGGA